MNDFEQQLRHALRREEPPDGFADRVLARVKTPAPTFWQRILGTFPQPSLRWAAAGVLCLLVVAGVRYQREWTERREGELARQRVLLALRITSSKLQSVQERVQQIGLAGQAARLN